MKGKSLQLAYLMHYWILRDNGRIHHIECEPGSLNDDAREEMGMLIAEADAIDGFKKQRKPDYALNVKMLA